MLTGTLCIFEGLVDLFAQAEVAWLTSKDGAVGGGFRALRSNSATRRRQEILCKLRKIVL